MSKMRVAPWTAGLAALLVVTVTSGAQEPQIIAPGMSEDEVVAALGAPQGKSSYGEYTFYFYDNGCERECGFPDTVFFRGGQVVDAVLRATWREYDGESSSPKGTVPRATPGGERLQMPTADSVEVRPAETTPTPPVEEKRDTTAVRD